MSSKPTQPDQPTSADHQSSYPTRVADIRRAVRGKFNEIFLLTAPEGDIQPGMTGQGVYFRDMRFLDRLELRLNGKEPIALMTDAASGEQLTFVLANAELDLPDGGHVPKERLRVTRRYTVGNPLGMEIQVRSLAGEPVALTLTVAAGADFADMFTVRGSAPGKRGDLKPPQAQGDTLHLAYDGADGHTRTTTIAFTSTPDTLNADTATFHLRLGHGEEATVSARITLRDTSPHHAGDHASQPARQRHAALRDLFAEGMRVATDNAQFDDALHRSFADLRMLATADHGDAYIAAGIPWYVALFGRDSLISAFEVLAFQPRLARGTLELLASLQGTTTNAFQHEAPGKILHELRSGERANLREIPQIPYYATVDATPLFLITLDHYLRWTNDLEFFTQMRSNVDRALAWIETNLRQSATGFLEYGAAADAKLINQGWKDSDNGIVNRDGSLARPPIALVEAQGYVYAAQRGIARALRQTGEADRADHLERAAADLRRRFDAAFWMDDANYYALCLQRGGEQARVIASNPGQTLFTGITPPERVAPIIERLLSGPMFSGWGIRTLATTEAAYNPMEYQLGSVWPHDNALIALGLRQNGHPEAFERVFTAIFEAALRFEEKRLPEVFDGFGRDEFAQPVRYPVACSPQAWAAGALPLLLQAALGLEPDAANHRLVIRQPALPAWLNQVTVKDLRLGDATIDLRFQRAQATTYVAVPQIRGDARVVIEE